MSRARTLVGEAPRPSVLSASHQSAASPATCGQAMLVPLSASRPPPDLAETMFTPGALTSARLFEKSATLRCSPSRPTAATERTSSAAAGREAAIFQSSC